MKKGKFNAASVDAAISNISQAINQAPRVVRETVEEPVRATKKEEVPQASGAAQPTDVPAKVRKGGGSAPAAPVSKPNEAEEACKNLNIKLPMSIYRRLASMKLDCDGEKLNTLAIRAISEFLERNRY